MPYNPNHLHNGDNEFITEFSPPTNSVKMTNDRIEIASKRSLHQTENPRLGKQFLCDNKLYERKKDDTKYRRIKRRP
ncbi:hypothetical protein BDA99DRAFT_503806 [Phascolomyces articulosus]|uniref:Uncharacterized protein n=1 Tax=Phascolomyces articulosus TaxID=60185 RepID=A0AAD5K4X0_9FUNG|nr:hypothetical protein BDA99DRAFT_503806 [Phascolomyces articulosus]